MNFTQWCTALGKLINDNTYQEWKEREFLIEQIAQRVVEIMSQSQSQNKK